MFFSILLYLQYLILCNVWFSACSCCSALCRYLQLMHLSELLGFELFSLILLIPSNKNKTKEGKGNPKEIRGWMCTCPKCLFFVPYLYKKYYREGADNPVRVHTLPNFTFHCIDSVTVMPVHQEKKNQYVQMPQVLKNECRKAYFCLLSPNLVISHPLLPTESMLLLSSLCYLTKT